MNDLRRHGDFADMPRQIAWWIISIREVGLPAIVIGALLYICFVSQNKMTDALKDVAIAMNALNVNDHTIIQNQQLILQRVR